MIEVEKNNIGEIEGKIYADLSQFDFIPKRNGNVISYNEGKSLKSLAKEELVSLAKALGKIKGYGYRHNNLSLDNVLFNSDHTLASIIGWDNVSLDRSLDDLIYIICNYVDMEENYYSKDYAIDVIVSMLEVYDSFNDDVDLSYELYWYIVNKLNTSSSKEEYDSLKAKLDFIVYYKPYLDSTHVEDI